MIDPKTPYTEMTNEIAGAILQMLNTLHLLNGLPNIPFSENVKLAVERFDRAELREQLVNRLYHLEYEMGRPRLTELNVVREAAEEARERGID